MVIAMVPLMPRSVQCPQPWLLLLLPCLLLSADLRLDPVFQRLDLEPGGSTEVVFTLRAASGTVATAVVVDCACLGVLTKIPATVDGHGALDLRFRASGIRPGVEPILVATTAGMVRAELQIAGPGTGDGRDVLGGSMTRAKTDALEVWGIVHDLRGQVRHCSCSRGSLGGIGRLASLPDLAAGLVPGVTTRWILSGDIDGKRAGVGAALAERGWRLGDAAVQVSADPGTLLAAPGVVVVIPTVPIAAQHRRLLRPVLDGGLAVELLLVDAAGAVRDRRSMPVDGTLPEDTAMPARFPDRLTQPIDAQSTPSTTCATCHPGAYQAWSAGPHAQAWNRLPEADRVDGCISCHTTPQAGAALARAVNCQACHSGSDLHVASGGKLRTTGAVDCRSCHDAKHHPSFQRETGWKLVQHGREPAVPAKP